MHQSRLRTAKGRPPGAAPYTPLPMLNPSRHGPGLFWNTKLKTKSGMTQSKNILTTSLSLYLS